MPDYGKSRLRLFFSLREPFSPASRRCLAHFARRLTCPAREREVLSRILGVLRVGLHGGRRCRGAGGGGRRGSVVGRVVTQGRIRGEWTIPRYQLGTSRLPRADKLLHPHPRAILIPNQADLCCRQFACVSSLSHLPRDTRSLPLVPRSKYRGTLRYKLTGKLGAIPLFDEEEVSTLQPRFEDSWYFFFLL